MLTGPKDASTSTAVIAGALDTLVALVALLAAQSSVLMAWLAMRQLGRGASEAYEYGIGKLENLSSLIVSALMGRVFIVITVNALRGLLSPSHVGGIGVTISLAAQLIFGSINGWLWRRCRRTAQAEDSPLMASQAKLFFTKLFGNVFIFASLALSLMLADQSWSVFIDPVASLVIAGSILVSAIGVFSSSVYDLVDGTLEEKDKLDIMREMVTHFHRYDSLHGVRSRRAGNRVFIDIHVGFDAERRIGDVEQDIAAIRSGVMRHFKNASVTVVLGPEHRAMPASSQPS